MTARVVVGSRLLVAGLPREAEARIRRELTLPNPEHLAAVRRGYAPRYVPETLTLFRYEGEVAVLPRGYLDRLKALVPCEVLDRRLRLPEVELGFRGELRPYQAQACGRMELNESGILVAPAGSGKTCMGMWLVARRRQPALVLCHTLDLGRQLGDNARRWLGVEPGFIGDGSWRVGEAVTVALVQSLTSRPEATDELSKRIGLVLLDEAHHAPAVTFTEVMQRFPAAFRYGLTATPTRRDGLQPFMEAVIGPVRARVFPGELQQAGALVRPRLGWVRTGFRFAYRDERGLPAHDDGPGDPRGQKRARGRTGRA